MKFEIRNRWANNVMFEVEAESFLKAVEQKVKESADLRGAYLGGADLGGADLGGADLGGAYLGGAYLRDLLRSNSVHTLLTTIDWGQIPDDLTLEMMRHDAESCGLKAMTAWANNSGGCPFSNSVRDYQFQENKALWVPGPPQYRGTDLLKKLCVAKGIKTEDVTP